jgi:lipid-A-disaccharide synthase
MPPGGLGVVISSAGYIIYDCASRFVKQPVNIMIVAGEASGDTHAAKLVNAIRSIRPDTSFFGAAGPQMRSAGVDAVVLSDDLAIVGILEIARALPLFSRAFKKLTNAAISRQPSVVILVDFPDFNLKLAKRLKRRGFKIVYYISPQLWAWRKYRVETVRKFVDLMITILPFEKAWYKRHGIDHVEYVGSPLAREISATQTKTDFCKAHGLDPERSLVSMMPGSRTKEIGRVLPPMLEAAQLIKKSRPETQYLIPITGSRNRADVETVVQTFSSQLEIFVIADDTYNALNASDAAAITSGTATLEAGFIGTPLVVVYKTSALNYALLEPLIDVPHYGLINLIAEERVATELIQKNFSPDRLADEILRLLEPEANREMRERLKKATEKLGRGGGASGRAAEAILRVIQ